MAEQKHAGAAGIDRSSLSVIERRRLEKHADDLEQSQWQRLALLIGDRKSMVGGLAALSVCGAICEAGLLAITARAAAALVNRSHGVHGKFGILQLNLSVSGLLWVGIGFAFLRLLIQIPTSYLPARIAGDVQKTMRDRLLHAYTYSSWEKQSKDREGYFQEMMTNQIAQASQGATQATALIVSASTFFILVLSAFALNAVAAVGTFVAAVILFAALRPANNLAMRLSRRLSAAQLEYAGSVGEANRMTEEIDVFGVGDDQVGRVSGFIMAARALYVKTMVLGRLIPSFYQSIIYLIVIAGLLVISTTSTTGFTALGAVVLLLIRAGSYGQTVQSVWVSLRQSLPYVERLQNALNDYNSVRQPKGEAALDQIETLTFEAVDYHYRPGTPVLKHIDWTVFGGETIGIIGPSGAGKSTTVQILLRLREPRSGRYLVNGVDASRISKADWHARVAYVPQTPKLLHASVADNVRFYRDFDDDAVERACRLARVHDEIMSWPNGYQTIVGPRADAVSGGQQQRICLARALVAEPTVLVLDEPTSALDPRSEALIQQSLASLQNRLTLFIVAHRMSTLTICDRIMVILDGEIDGFDSLAGLDDTNEYYRFASGIASSFQQRGTRSDFEAASVIAGDLPLIAPRSRRHHGQPASNGSGPTARAQTVDGDRADGGAPGQWDASSLAGEESASESEEPGSPAAEQRAGPAGLGHAADVIARQTGIEALIGRPTIVKNQLKTLRNVPQLDTAIAAVKDRLDPELPGPDDEPLFVFSAGWRSGSTLLQRLIVSADTYFLWGEPYHQCDLVRRLAESLLPFGNGWPPPEYLHGTDATKDYRGEKLSAEWIANLYPSVSTLVDAHRQALRTYLAPPAERPDIGWGMKEVRLAGEYGLYLRLLFPRARFIFLVRDPRSAYRSYRERPTWFERWPRSQVRTPYAFGQLWRRLADSFLEYREPLDATLVRYEELVEGSEAIERLEQVLGAPVDRSVLVNRLGGTGGRNGSEPSSLELRMLDRATQPTAQRLGYSAARSGVL
jgi:ABC-type multidrug transport system fused ATPase/permease subunit